MAKWGKCDYKQLQKLRDDIAKLEETDMDRFCRDMSKELAARLLALVIPRTPVGDYAKYKTVTATRDSKYHKRGDTYRRRVGNPSGKKGGTLRRGWTARTEEQAAGGGWTMDPVAYAWECPVTKRGNDYIIEVINPVHYASYVELGHRTPGGGWVKGQYFLTASEQDIREHAPEWIEKRLEKELKKLFNVWGGGLAP